MPCSPLKINRPFGGTCRFRLPNSLAKMSDDIETEGNPEAIPSIAINPFSLLAACFMLVS
jgi:hypothetical protein